MVNNVRGRLTSIISIKMIKSLKIHMTSKNTYIKQLGRFQYTNSGLTTVVTTEQPLYALAKVIQWLWPDTYGETKFVILMGGLIHIEMASLSVLKTG